ncbi:hypothetical protein DL765_004994 [Monosporascus sp. GIB2]|nr:hypothetical protein DL765_004994 [Monosporascus sp. GIB2]
MAAQSQQMNSMPGHPIPASTDEERLGLAAPTPKERSPIQHERAQATIDDGESGHIASPPSQQHQHFLLDTSVRGIRHARMNWPVFKSTWASPGRHSYTLC